jgi:hypothetical protein
MSKKRLNSNALVLIKLLTDKKLAAADLQPHQRKVIVKYYMEEMSYVSNGFIGDMIGCTDVHVSRLKRNILRKSIWEIDDIDIKALALSLKKRKEEYQRAAHRAGNIGLAWAIECEFIEKMQKLGFVYEAPQKHLVGSMEVNLEEELRKTFREMGVPGVNDFVQLVEQARRSITERREAKRLMAGKPS